MTTENIYCDYCEKITTKESEKIEDLNGFSFELGYSKRGWGRRRDFYVPHSALICDSCFNSVQDKAIDLCKTISSLRKDNQTLWLRTKEYIKSWMS